MFIQGGSTSRSNPLHFIYHFSRKTYPFRIHPIDKWYPFHKLCLEVCIPRRTFSRLNNLLDLLGPFTDPNDRFLYPLIHINERNPYPFISLMAEKDTPFTRSLPVLAIIRSTPRRAWLPSLHTINPPRRF